MPSFDASQTYRNWDSKDVFVQSYMAKKVWNQNPIRDPRCFQHFTHVSTFLSWDFSVHVHACSCVCACARGQVLTTVASSFALHLIFVTGFIPVCLNCGLDTLRVSGEGKSWLRNCLHQIGLWVGLIVNWYSRAQSTVVSTIPGQVDLDYVRKPANHESVSEPTSLVYLWLLLQWCTTTGTVKQTL